MTIDAATSRDNYTGTGSTDTYSFTFTTSSENDLIVVSRDTSNVETTLAKDTDYTVSRNSVTGTGSITLVSGNLTTGYTLSILLSPSVVQDTEIRNQGVYYPETHENQFDKATRIDIKQQDEINRSLKLPYTFTSADFDPSLPTELPGTANVAIVTNATGNGLSVGPTTSEISNAQTYASNASSSAMDSEASATASLYSATESLNSATASSLFATAAQAAADSVAWSDVSFKTYSDSPITLTDNDKGTLFSIDTSLGNVVVNLPAISGLDLSGAFAFGLKKTTSDGNTITINRNGTETIDGVTSLTIQSSDSGVTLVPDTDPSPDEWTSVGFGAVTGDITTERFSGTGAQTNFTLSVDPGSENNTWVYLSGTYQQKDTYSVSGTTLSFSSAPASGTDNIEVNIGTTSSIGTPADGTVDADKCDLDFYATGTFTPVLTGSTTPPNSVTYSSQLGEYTRIGNMVYVNVHININAFTLGSGAGDARITGLPFTCDTRSHRHSLGISFDDINLSASAIHITASVGDSTDYIHFRESYDNSIVNTLAISAFQAGSSFEISGIYFI